MAVLSRQTGFNALHIYARLGSLSKVGEASTTKNGNPGLFACLKENGHKK
jgi:hypothetical protein